MKKTRIQFLSMAGLFLLIGQVFSDEPLQTAIKQIRESLVVHRNVVRNFFRIQGLEYEYSIYD